MSAQFNLAIEDFFESFRRYKLWLYLGYSDIQLRYKGSILGPFWITMSMSIFIIAFGLIYGNLFHQPMDSYIPFLTCGILTWTYISNTLVDSCEVFHNARNLICQIKLPFLIHMLRIIWRNIIIFLHNIVVYIFVACTFQITPHFNTLLFFPGFLLITINLTLIGLFLGLLATRYRDMPPIITSLLQILFFISPITWTPNLLGSKAAIAKLNPVFYYIDIVRSPLLGQTPNISSWIMCGLFTMIIFFMVSPFYIISRRNIPYWL